MKISKGEVYTYQMKYNTARERRRKELAKLELDLMEARYPDECGDVLVRKATQEEINRMNKLNKKKG